MKTNSFLCLMAISTLGLGGDFKLLAAAPANQAQNPIIWADVPDMAMIRVGDNYYMSSTTMHLSPGLPIMKSSDLVNWRLVNYAYDILDDVDELKLDDAKSSYGRGSWASSLRYHDGTFYATTFSGTTGKTYVYSTKDIEKGPWKAVSFRPSLHDHSLFFDDDGRVYMLYGVGNLRLVELTSDLTGIKPGGLDEVVVTDAGRVAGANTGLPAEGSQLFKVGGRYYLFNISWPRGGMRTVILHRANKITGPYEGRVALQDKGVAQGGLIDTPQGQWYAYLFRDFGAVGRIPYLVPVTWEEGWPVLGVDGKVPDSLNLPASQGLIPGIVDSDEFDRRPSEPALPLVWQWNHNPASALWSLTERPGFLRLTTGRVDADLLSARNTLTQRTIGPQCSGATAVDSGNLKDGDLAGLALLQKNYGFVGVKTESGTRFVVMVSAQSGTPVEVERARLDQKTVFLKAECDFNNRADTARFFYSLDGQSWTSIGSELKMSYTIPHFMGYRFALFSYATETPGGFADFDFFRVSDQVTASTEDGSNAETGNRPHRGPRGFGGPVPMTGVMPSGRVQRNDRAEGNVFAASAAFANFDRDLLDDVIPAIESCYSTYTDRENRISQDLHGMEENDAPHVWQVDANGYGPTHRRSSLWLFSQRIFK